jgi:hypothetical protein
MRGGNDRSVKPFFIKQRRPVMPEMVICKSCGFIIEKGKVKDKCPACGVSAKMFLPHDERISPRRKMLLSLDIHPVMVHFPQAFTAMLLLLSLTGLAVHGPLRPLLEATIRTLGVLLPFTLALSLFSGLFDGKIRFRKVKTPLLIRKMILGAVFLILGCSVALCVLLLPATTPLYFAVVAAIALPALGCATILGLIGTSLLNARFPG